MSKGSEVDCKRDREMETDGGLFYLSLSSASWLGDGPLSPSEHSLALWLSHTDVTVWVWVPAYMISWMSVLLVVNPCDLLPAVSSCELLTPTHRCLSVYTAGTWQLCLRSICNIKSIALGSNEVMSQLLVDNFLDHWLWKIKFHNLTSCIKVVTIKLLLMQTMLMIYYFLQIHLLKRNICCITWSRQQEILKWCHLLITWQTSEISR